MQRTKNHVNFGIWNHTETTLSKSSWNTRTQSFIPKTLQLRLELEVSNTKKGCLCVKPVCLKKYTFIRRLFLPLLKNAVSFSVTAPEKPSKVDAILTENNKIIVTCKFTGKFKGPDNGIIAYLCKGGDCLKKYSPTNNCQFEFENLHYLTHYSVKVCVATIANKSLISFIISWLISSVICIFRWFLITDTMRALLWKKISKLPVRGSRYGHTHISHLHVLNTDSCDAPVFYASFTFTASTFILQTTTRLWSAFSSFSSSSCPWLCFLSSTRFSF